MTGRPPSPPVGCTGIEGDDATVTKAPVKIGISPCPSHQREPERKGALALSCLSAGHVSDCSGAGAGEL